MRGTFVAVWPELWRALWVPLARHPDFGADLFVDLHREFIPPPEPPKPVLTMDEDELLAFRAVHQRYEDVIADPGRARRAFRRWLLESVGTETAAIAVLERGHGVVEAYGDAGYVAAYVSRVERVIATFNLPYDLRRPFSIHPTLPGVFAALMRALQAATQADPHLRPLMAEFEDAFRDLRGDTSAGRIKTCMQKQFNLIEAMGRRCPNVTRRTLGQICDELNTWPHEKVKEAMKNLYGFASDYPGIRHGGTPESALRAVEMRDLVSLSILLVGFVPYLGQSVDSEAIYRTP